MNHQPKNSPDPAVPESIDRVKPLGEIAPNRCPKCSGEMELGDLDSNLVILCTACKSILIQSQIFAQIIQTRRREYSGADAIPTPLDTGQYKRKLACPGCQKPMDVHPYHGPGNIVIDSCSKCWFTFLDYGELASLEKAPGRR